MTWTLTWKLTGKLTEKGNNDPQPIDGSHFRPDKLADLSENALRDQTLRIGRTTRRFDELFEIEGEAGTELVLRQLPSLNRLGAGMTSGTLVIEGDAGDDLGASMSGGLIIVKGNAGDRAGGPDFECPRGMTGGEILITGNAGKHLGHLMRRGLIAVNGTCSDSPGYRMLAGTIVIGKGPVDHPGLEMQRGTILCTGMTEDQTPGEHLSLAGKFAASAAVSINMVLRRVRSLQQRDANSSNANDQPYPTTFQLWHGDRFELNKGEFIQCLC